MNGGAVEIIGHFAFMLSLVEAFLGFFSRINCELFVNHSSNRHLESNSVGTVYSN